MNFNKLLIFLFILFLFNAGEVFSQGKFQFEKLDELVEFGKLHTKLVNKQIKEAKKLEDKITLKANREGEKRREIYNAYFPEVYAYRFIQNSLKTEAQFLNLIDTINRYRYDDGRIREAIRQANFYVSSIDDKKKEVEKNEAKAIVLLHNAVSRNSDPKIVEILRRGVAAHKNVYGYYDQQEATITKFLNICCQTSISDIVRRRADARQAEYDAFNRWYNKRENAKEAGVAVIVGFELLSVLTQVLNSSSSSSTEKGSAGQRMRELNEQARMNCLFRGGTYYPGGDFTIGTCSK